MTAEARRPSRPSHGLCLVGAVALAVSLVALVAGCSTVPSSGPVMFEPMGTQAATETSLPVLVNGPEPGDSPQQVARGFLDAMASYQAGQPVARKYLTPAMSERWQPNQVFIYDSTPVPLAEPKSGKVFIDVRKVGGLGVNGDWTSARPGERLRLDLGMTKVAGQWRVGRPPAALVMSIYNFQREYESYNLYFFDPNFEILVPDPIYLPIRSHVETLLVNALLRGPSAWLKPTVRTAFPERTTLAAPSVTVEGNVATVDLDPRVDSLYEPQRRYLLAQLSWTLDQIPKVKKIQVTAGRAPFSVGGNGGSNTTSADQWATYDPRVAGAATGAYALNDRKVVLVGSDRTVPVSSLAGRPVEARSIAVGIFGERSSPGRLGPEDPRGSADWLAAVSTDGRKVNLYGANRSSPHIVWQGRDILEPSWDRTGKLWMVDRNRGRARIEVLDERDRLGTVDAPGLNGKDVRGLKISREGSRAAVLVRQGNRTVLMVGRVERGEGLAIRGLRELPLDLTRMTDLAWSQLDEVTVIGSEGQAAASRAVKVSVDGYSMTPLTGPDSTSLAAAPGQPVLLGGSDGVLQREDKTYMWSNQGAGRCPAYPG
ncbi:LpqB family beta-propeller domain-containing protein [Actinopolymorpha singaporensis]|uniref:Sporulation and spore germination n=1 Tax=Actinopolymorpha singaporensis TaxID=117157 RepID=A0A1H1SWV7_9ACTN|nr:LpqB family beta-propeller domain-containing protein [Actinopolymorpha singaporensis]SDS52421.1 Sporulation and spore germination [Actinopolymorpha singaporensis]